MRAITPFLCSLALTLCACVTDDSGPSPTPDASADAGETGPDASPVVCWYCLVGFDSGTWVECPPEDVWDFREVDDTYQCRVDDGWYLCEDPETAPPCDI